VKVLLIYSNVLEKKAIDSLVACTVNQRDACAVETKIKGSVSSFDIEHLTNTHDSNG
jgi:hypothetical protein